MGNTFPGRGIHQKTTLFEVMLLFSSVLGFGVVELVYCVVMLNTHSVCNSIVGIRLNLIAFLSHLTFC